ncbi:Rap family tetratricopeptide repeat protein [Bacillus subtilis]
MGGSLLSSAEVGVKISKWMYHIRKFNVADAEMWRAEINRDMENVEFDQDLKLYKQLVDYRHDIMLSHVKPINVTREYVDFGELSHEIEFQNKEMSGLLHYYAYLFRGMSEFRNGNFVVAITYYKQAEKYVVNVKDEAEKAEYYFKLAEVYYNMKQTYFSMHYAVLARDTYRNINNYGNEVARCQFVIAGNLLDAERHNEALDIFKAALDYIKSGGDHYFLGLAYYNVGMCLHQMGRLNDALGYLDESIKIYRRENSHNLKRALFTKAHVLYKLDRDTEANVLCCEGEDLCKKFEDELTSAKYKFLKHLYIEKENSCKIEGDLRILEENDHLADVEELAIDAADYYTRIGRLEEANKLYKKSILTRKEIQRGGIFCEDYDGSGNVNFFSRT